MGREILMDLCKTPRSFTELKKITGMSDAGLSKALKKLVEDGYLTKVDRKYVSTGKGLTNLVYRNLVYRKGIFLRYSGIPQEAIDEVANILSKYNDFMLWASRSDEEAQYLMKLYLLRIEEMDKKRTRLI